MNWGTRDIGLAAYISLKGQRPNVVAHRSICWFVFCRDAKDHKAEYYDGRAVAALPYYQEIGRLRRAMHRALDAS